MIVKQRWQFRDGLCVYFTLYSLHLFLPEVMRSTESWSEVFFCGGEESYKSGGGLYIENYLKLESTRV